MIRFLTAGESHGQALVVIVEGLPAGLAVTTEDVQHELARRRLGYGRGPRMRFEQDEITLLAGIRHGRTLGSPVAIEIANTEWSRSDKWHEEMSPGTGRHPVAADAAPPRPRRSGRHAEVRLQRRPRRAGAGQRPRDGGARGRRLGGQAPPAPARHRGHQPRRADGRGPRQGRRPAHARRSRHRRRLAGALLRPGGRGGHGGRGGGGGQGGRQPGRHRGGAGVGRARRPRQPRALGPQARRAAGPGGDEHPGGEGRGGGRRVRGGGASGQRRPRPHRVGRQRRAATAASPPSPAAWRAA